MAEKCEHCGKLICFCASRRYIAKVEYIFYGGTKQEIDQQLKAFYAKVKKIDLSASVAIYPGSADQNRYAERVKDEIVQLVVTLINSYSIDKEELDFFIENLKDKAERQAVDERRWEEAERRNDELRGK